MADQDDLRALYNSIYPRDAGRRNRVRAIRGSVAAYLRPSEYPAGATKVEKGIITKRSVTIIPVPLQNTSRGGRSVFIDKYGPGVFIDKYGPPGPYLSIKADHIHYRDVAKMDNVG